MDQPSTSTAQDDETGVVKLHSDQAQFSKSRKPKKEADDPDSIEVLASWHDSSETNTPSRTQQPRAAPKSKGFSMPKMKELSRPKQLVVYILLLLGIFVIILTFVFILLNYLP